MKKTKFDLLSFKNAKYLLYRLNNFQNSTGQTLIKVKHSLVTDNYIAAEETQNQNWQYFIERIIEVCKSKEVGSSIEPTENFLLTTVENVTLTKKSYETFYNLTVCSCHVTYAFESESTIYSCLNVKELLARSRRQI